jgi:hypothetical protein
MHASLLESLELLVRSRACEQVAFTFCYNVLDERGCEPFRLPKVTQSSVANLV